MDLKFAEEIKNGLGSEKKYLNSMYFYDKRGSEIFQSIMKMPEYYLTRSEFEILETQKEKFYGIFKNESLNLVEFGSGDASKTKILLKYFVDKKVDFTYMPIDISLDILNELENNLNKEIPDLHLKTLNGDYFNCLHTLKKDKIRRSAVLFFGSNIGNFPNEKSISFINKINNELNDGDYLVIGFDLKKDPRIIQDAYDDPHGITAEFNLNLLRRINREFNADFDINKFKHYGMYDPRNGEARSYIISLKDHSVNIKDLDMRVDFKYGEEIFTELSRKFNKKDIEDLAIKTNFEIVNNYYDCKEYFCVSIWKK